MDKFLQLEICSALKPIGWGGSLLLTVGKISTSFIFIQPRDKVTTHEVCMYMCYYVHSYICTYATIKSYVFISKWTCIIYYIRIHAYVCMHEQYSLLCHIPLLDFQWRMTTTIMAIIARPTTAPAIIPMIRPIFISSLSSFLSPFLFVILSTENTNYSGN